MTSSEELWSFFKKLEEGHAPPVVERKETSAGLKMYVPK